MERPSKKQYIPFGIGVLYAYGDYTRGKPSLLNAHSTPPEIVFAYIFGQAATIIVGAAVATHVAVSALENIVG